LRKQPLDFKHSFRAHIAIVEAEKSFVKSNGRRSPNLWSLSLN
jgi:hypothetical protein